MSHYDLTAWPLFRSVMAETADDADKPSRCFVIAPGAGCCEDMRRQAETLLKYVIRPALLDSDYNIRRGDTDKGATQDAIDAILDDDLVIAVLSPGDCQAFYQIAIAQAAARPIVMMIEEGLDMPIDPRGAAVVTYKLDTDSVLSAAAVTRLQAAIAAIEENETPVRQTFRPGASALNGGGSGGATVIERSRQFTYDQRLALMRDAKTRIDIMGVANLALAQHPDAVEMLRSRSGLGIEIRILQCAPLNPGLPALMSGQDPQKFAAVCAEIETAAETWKRLAETPDIDIALTIRRTQSTLPLANALLTDKAVVATPYLASRDTADSPALQAPAGSAYYRVMAEEFETAWREASTVHRIEPSRPRRDPAPLKIPAEDMLMGRPMRPQTAFARSFRALRGK
jgi:hypothetical protein